MENKPTVRILDKEVKEYILGTLLFIPLRVLAGKYRKVEIRVYGAEEKHLLMKIFRMIACYHSQPGDPEGTERVSFQDEVDILKPDGGRHHNIRSQVNFTILVKESDKTFVSIVGGPEVISNELKQSLNIFKDACDKDGSTLYVENGLWKFNAQGGVWVQEETRFQESIYGMNFLDGVPSQFFLE